jgi:hypothetical protein
VLRGLADGLITAPLGTEMMQMSPWMSGWKKVVLINGACLTGIGSSLFMVPPKTPLWLWATVAGLAVLLLNYLFFGRKRNAADVT